MAEKSLVKSALNLTLGTLVSRIIGVLYVFLFSSIVSSEGLALYTYAYIPYAIFLDLATLGIPTGITRIIAQQKEKEKLSFSYTLYRKVRLLSFLLGLSMFILMFSLSDPLAARILAGGDLTNRVRDVSRVIKLVSFALLIIPNLALLRGIFNSLKKTKETAVSQIIEQLIRVGIILISAILIIHGLKQSYVRAINMAVLAAGISGFVAYFILLFRYHRLLKKEGISSENQTNIDNYSLKELIMTTVIYSLPAVLITLLIGLYGFIDTLTFNSAILRSGQPDPEIQYATYAFEVHKLINLPIAFGISLGTSFIVYHKEKDEPFHHKTNRSFETLYFTMIPLVMLLLLYGRETYQTLFSFVNPYGPTILKASAPLILPLAFLHMTSGILQSIHREWRFILVLCVGIVFKYLFNTPFIMRFGANGAILTSFISMSLCVLILLIFLFKELRLDRRYFLRRLVLMSLIATGLSGLFAFFQRLYPTAFQSRFETLLYISGSGMLYLMLYVGVSYVFGLMDCLTGRNLKRKNGVKRKNFVKREGDVL